MPDLNALALSVVVRLMVRVPLYLLDRGVGVLPLVVYRITAPLVLHDIPTLTLPVYVPGDLVKLGVETDLVEL